MRTDFVMIGLTVSSPIVVTLCAVTRVARGGGRDAGAPDEAESCQAAGGEAAGAEARGSQAGLARFGQQRPGGRGLGLWWRPRWTSGRRSLLAEDLVICSQ